MHKRTLAVAAAAVLLGARCERVIDLPTLHTGLDIDSSRLRPGLALRYVEGAFSSAAEVENAGPGTTGVMPRLELPEIERPEQFGLRFAGYLRVPFDDFYTFEITSDDGSQLYIDEILVVDNDKIAGVNVKSGTIGLRKGHHRLRVNYFQGAGAKRLALRVLRADGSFHMVPDAWYYVEDPLAPDVKLPMTDAP